MYGEEKSHTGSSVSVQNAHALNQQARQKKKKKKKKKICKVTNGSAQIHNESFLHDLKRWSCDCHSSNCDHVTQVAIPTLLQYLYHMLVM